MSIFRIYTIFLRQWYLIRSNPTRLSGIFTWILIDVILWGFISRFLAKMGGVSFNYVAVILGAIILWEFTVRLQAGVLMGFLEDIWTQNFMNLFASPLKIGEYIAGLILTSFASGAFGFLLMAIIAGLFFGYNVFAIGMMLLPFLLVLLVFGLAMGIFVVTMIFRLGPSAEWLGWPIPAVLSVFAGVFYPISVLPQALQYVSKIIPASYVFESLRSILAGGGFSAPVGQNLLVGGMLAVIYFFLVYFLFLKVYRRNLKNGSIARFNAEEF